MRDAGALIPCLLAFCVVPSRPRRAVFVLVLVGAGAAVTALSAALSWGPAHAWAWLSMQAQFGMVLAGTMALLLALAPWRTSASLLLLALGIYLSLLNQAPGEPIFCPNPARLGAGPIYPFPWSGPVVGLVVALRHAVVCAVTHVAA